MGEANEGASAPESFAAAIFASWIDSNGESDVLSRIPMPPQQFYREPRFEDGDKYLPHLVALENYPPRLVYRCSSIWLDGSGNKRAFADQPAYRPPTLMVRAPIWDVGRRSPDVELYTGAMDYLGHYLAVANEWRNACRAFFSHLRSGRLVATSRTGSALASRTEVPPEAWDEIKITDWVLNKGEWRDGTTLYALQVDTSPSSSRLRRSEEKPKGRPNDLREAVVSLLGELYPGELPSSQYDAIRMNVQEHWSDPRPAPSLETVKRALDQLREERESAK